MMQAVRCNFLAVLCAVAFCACPVHSALAQAIHSQVTINPIQVCDDNGSNCGNPDRQLFLAETDKIWRQAGIDIKFLDWKLMLDSDFTSNVELGVIASTPGNMEIGGDVINMWFVNSILDGPFGVAGGGETLISDGIFSFSAGAGRRDTISHEIGHVLGLPHIAGDVPLNLMEAGGDRLAATALDQIYPNGSQRSQLNESQISTALNSFRVNSLEFSIPGDANLDGEVDGEDIDAFIAGWRYEQQEPDLTTWMKGDFNHDAITDLADAFILRTALLESGASSAAITALVPEPSTSVQVLGCILLLAVLRFGRVGRYAR